MKEVAAQLLAEGMSEREAVAKDQLCARCAEVLDERQQAAFFVPGRIEILGKHTDYAGGRSLLCTLERGFVLLVAPRADAKLRVTDVLRAETRELPLDQQADGKRGDWSNYVATVARRVARNFPEAHRGADLAFASDLPAAAGMSSSSAFVIGSFLAIAAVNELTAQSRYRTNIGSREALAGYLATVENGQSFGGLEGDLGVGTFGGSEDHTAILCCRAGFLSQYAFSPVRAERQMAFPVGRALVVAYSGVAAEKTGSTQASYNRISSAVQQILSIWNEATGRADQSLAVAIASEPSAQERMRHLLANSQSHAFTAQRLVDRFDQFVLESFDLIPHAGDAFEDGNLVRFGELVDRSQWTAENLLGNQIPETIALARLARSAGADAASAFGAGFGGSVWALVRASDADRFAQGWREAYRGEYPVAAARSDFIVTKPGSAATFL